MRSFSEWKTKTIVLLSNLELADNNCELLRQSLIHRLEWIRKHDLYNVIVRLDSLVRHCGVPKSVLPTPEEVDNWFSQND